MNFYEKFMDECVKKDLVPSKAMVDMGLSKSTLTRWKYNQSLPSDYLLSVVANFFQCDLDELSTARDASYVLRAQEVKKGKIVPMGKKPNAVPLLGTIACGAPILAIENIEEMIPSPPKVNADFALSCKGESMINARIFPGDIVYIKRQPVVENGEIAAVLIGDEATLKRVYIFKNRLTLMAENPLFDPINLVGEEMNQATILGKAVAVVSFLNTKNL